MPPVLRAGIISIPPPPLLAQCRTVLFFDKPIVFALNSLKPVPFALWELLIETLPDLSPFLTQIDSVVPNEIHLFFLTETVPFGMVLARSYQIRSVYRMGRGECRWAINCYWDIGLVEFERDGVDGWILAGSDRGGGGGDDDNGGDMVLAMIQTDLSFWKMLRGTPLQNLERSRETALQVFRLFKELLEDQNGTDDIESKKKLKGGPLFKLNEILNAKQCAGLGESDRAAINNRKVAEPSPTLSISSYYREHKGHVRHDGPSNRADGVISNVEGDLIECLKRCDNLNSTCFVRVKIFLALAGTVKRKDFGLRI
ncbi:predicted protein [Uncinocarpus reesii 1704]|uniref:Uncharacterized protein n=1 Tax=Uncinocarpus reesii (strain UAMH 1704) TaxID=336963 RepID=C4JEB4_UNCRE|nr:uncharacterized protein UREG_00746 [Uncinocarpus reesii 1704]EEP75899.1 predicted protein [Uncinocarpus reesii 1704]